MKEFTHLCGFTNKGKRMNRLKSKVKDCCFSILAPITIALYQILFLALNNVEEISLKDIGVPMGISVSIVLCFMAFFCVLLKDPL